MWGIRIIIPGHSQRAIIEELHSGHLGVVKIKSLARSYVWWPQIDMQIEECTKQCSTCQGCAKPTSTNVATSMESHIDFAGPFEGLAYMVLVDAYLKWHEVFIMKSITSERTVLRSVFARYGLPQSW